MNTENKNTEIVNQITAIAVSSGLVNIRTCWNKRV